MKLNLPSFNGMSEQGINFKMIIKSVFMSYVLSIVLLAIFAAVLTYTSFPETSISAVVMAVSIISILYAAKMAAVKGKNRGWLIGATAGLLYMFILYLISLVFTHRPVLDSHILMVFGIGVLAGAIGGVIGINLRKNEKKRR